MCTDESKNVSTTMLKDHINTYQNNRIKRGNCRDHFKYENMIIVNMNDAWAFQSEGRKTNNVPTATSSKRKSSPPFRRTFTYAVWCQQTLNLLKLSLEQDHLIPTSCYDKVIPVL